MHPVRFPEIRRHLRQQLVLRNSDIHRKAQLLTDPLPNLPCCFLRCTEEMTSGTHIHKGFIYAVLLHHVRILPQNTHKGSRTSLIQTIIRGYKHKVRTLLLRLRYTLPRPHTVFSRRYGFGKNNPMAHGHIPSDSRRYLPQIQRPPTML